MAIYLNIEEFNQGSPIGVGGNALPPGDRQKNHLTFLFKAFFS